MISIVNVTKSEEDCKILFDWRNDPLTRSMSINQNLIEWNIFKDNYNNYFQSKITPVFGCFNNQKIIYCGFYIPKNYITKDDSEYYISLMMHPDFRGKKLAIPFLTKIIDYISIIYPFIKHLYAEIKSTNIPSIKTFTNIGFIKIDPTSNQTNNQTDLYHLSLL